MHRIRTYPTGYNMTLLVFLFLIKYEFLTIFSASALDFTKKDQQTFNTIFQGLFSYNKADHKSRNGFHHKGRKGGQHFLSRT
ncbi:hypothetical protein LINGRAHAP2_LOCUS36069 [Linum grandiflorum]